MRISDWSSDVCSSDLCSGYHNLPARTMTLTGLILIPIALVAIFMPWRYCLIALLVFSPLSAAAVVNAGNFGLQPGYFFGLLVVARTFTEMLIGQIGSRRVGKECVGTVKFRGTPDH